MKTRVVIYSKPECHLCEEAKREIRAAGGWEQYDFQEVNIENDPDLLQRYKLDVPVITINGVEAFRHRLTAEEFREKISRSH